MPRHSIIGACAVALALAAAAPAAPAAAQSLEDRIAAVGNGTVRLEFAARSGVCGNGRGNVSVRTHEGRVTQHGTTYDAKRRRNEWEDECEPGPVRLAIDVERRAVVAIRHYVGGRWRGEADRDLGAVSAAEASRYLLHIAATGPSRTAKDANFPAMIADAPDPWRDLLAIAKDQSRPKDVRASATFWVAQAASDAATDGITDLLDSGEREVRNAAVFALSQRPKDESVPALIRIARTHPDAGVRKSAVFWLGQSGDPRAVRYFEELLVGR